MKYLNIILTIIAVFLIVISLRIFYCGMMLRDFNENMPMIINSNQALINADFRLETEISVLRKQLELMSDKLFLKNNQDKKV